MRSATAHEIYKNDSRLEVKSAGTDPTASTVLSNEILGWADCIMVMEKHHRNHIRKHFPEIYNSKRIVCLFIPDEYDYMQAELVEMLKCQIEKYLTNPNTTVMKNDNLTQWEKDQWEEIMLGQTTVKRLIHWFSDKTIFVEKDGKYGILNLNKEILLPIEYDSIYSAGGGFLHIEKGKKRGTVRDGGNFYDILWSNT
jgi:predicted protein tyrosine phosphatase